MSKVVLRALDLIGQHLRTHKSGGGADAPLDLAKQIVQQRMDNPAPAAPPVAEKGNTTQGSVFAPKPRVVAPSGLYSHAAEVAGQLQQNKGSAEQMIGMMTNAGVKPAELEHAGMITPEGDVHPDFAGRTITRDELHKHLVDSMPQVEEKVLSEETKYSDRTLFGGENYRELLLKHVESPEAKLERVKSLIDPAVWSRMTEDQRNQFLSAPDKGIFKSGHWRGEPNVLAHIRMSDRSGPNDEKLLHVEELQSDWGQEGREHGFKNPELESRRAELTKSLADATQKQADEFERIHDQHAIDMGPYNKAYKNAMAEADKKFFSSKQGYSEQAEYNQVGEKVEEELAHLRKEADAKRHAAFNQYQYGTLYKEPIEKIKDELKKLPKSGDTPRGPYVTSTQGWTDLALKRVLKEAAEGGYHGIVFTPGAEQSKRYDLSQQIDELAHWREGDEIGLSASGREGTVLDQHYVSKEKLPSVVGKELAEKILNGEGSSKSVTGYPEEEGVNFISGEGLSVGGEGMKSYYDKMVPSYLQKLAKQHDKDAKLGQMEIPDSAPMKGGSGYDVMKWLPETNHMNDAQKEKYWASLENDERKQLFKRYFEENRDNKNITGFHLPVTDKMRESVLKGQKAFADGGEVEGYSKGGGKTTQGSVFAKQKVDKTEQPYGPVDQPALRDFLEKPSTNYKSWDDVPIINPQDLVGKKIGSLEADLTRAGGQYTGIDSSKIQTPEPMLGGPGYPLMGESQQHKLGWAVQGKGKGTQKLNKDFDYIAVHAMMPDSHRSNTSVVNSILGTLRAYTRDQRIPPENLANLNKLISKPSKDKELKELENFPGFNHPDLEKYVHSIGFNARAALVDRLWSAKAEELGSPQVGKILRDTLDKEFSGTPMGHAMYLLEIPKGSSDALVHLKESGLPIHPSYDWGIHGRIVGRFAHPVSREILHEPWFDEKLKEHAERRARGEKPDINTSFRRALPVTTITQDIADRLPHAPKDIQSAKAAQLALNAFNDHWHDTDTPVTEGGLGPATLSNALRNSDASSTLSQYSEKDIKDMKKAGKFTGYKLKDGEVYFGLQRGVNYSDPNGYNFHHPELTDNETALTSVVNNEPGAKGIGGAPVVLKALQHGATTLDAYAVPTDKHPNGFLPDFYSHFGFKKLGTIPFNEKYITHDENENEKPFGKQHLADIKHEWAKTGWDEKRHGLPSIAIMKWGGEDENRTDAVRRFVTQGGEGFGSGSNPTNVEAAAQSAGQGVGPSSGKPQRQRGLGDTSGNRGPVGADNAPRSSDRFTRTLAAVKNLSPSDAQHYGLASEDIDFAKANGLKRGGSVHPASIIPGVHIVGHNPIFHGDE